MVKKWQDFICKDWVGPPCAIYWEFMINRSLWIILFYLCCYFMITTPAFSCGNNMFYNLLLWFFQLNLIKTLQYTHCIHVANPWTSMCQEDEVVQNTTNEVLTFPEINKNGSMPLSSSLHIELQSQSQSQGQSRLVNLPLEDHHPLVETYISMKRMRSSLFLVHHIPLRPRIQGLNLTLVHNQDQNRDHVDLRNSWQTSTG